MTPSKMTRFRRFTAGTAAAAALASGVAFAFFLDSETYTGNTATSGAIELESSLGSPLSFTGLYPTSDPQAGSGESAAFTISNNNPVDVAYVLSAADASTTAEGQQQFNELYVRLTSGGGGTGSPTDVVLGGGEETVHFEGLLKDLLTESAIVLPASSGEKAFNLEVFLLETGAEQAQDATTTFSITIDAKTTPSDRASQLG